MSGSWFGIKVQGLAVESHPAVQTFLFNDLSWLFGKGNWQKRGVELTCWESCSAAFKMEHRFPHIHREVQKAGITLKM